MRILVAGATGAIGRRLVPMLVGHGHEVVGLTRRAAKVAELERAGARGEVVDALDAEAVLAAVRRARPDVVVHELTDLPAALSPRKLTAAYEANNRVRSVGTANLLAAARAADVRRIVAQGSAFWYRPGGSPAPRTEDSPLWSDAGEPVGAAVRTMAAVEETLLGADDVEAVVLRYGAFYGPGTWFAPDGAVGRQVRARRYPLVGEGAGITSFVHVDDAARATVHALDGPPGVYNVVDDSPAPAATWVPEFARALGARPPRRVPEWLARRLLGGGFVEWLSRSPGASNERAKAALGWRPEYADWRDGFARGLQDPPA
jgi:nucleoside-diphosphate-sugar epimerase